jgi:sugar O-acyltransferase (sialic acid O-acetyltransferase NeuD family)
VSAEAIAVYGAGGFAREVAWLAEQCGLDVRCFIDDDPRNHGKMLNDIPIMSLTDCAAAFTGIGVAAGIGSPTSRRAVIDRAIANGLRPWSLIHPRVEISKHVEFGAGVVVCAGNILTTNIIVRDHVQINLDCTVGHDVVLEEYATLAPGVHVSGYVHIGRGAYIGTGAAIINGTAEQPLVVGDGAVVGAGACVTRSIEPGVTAVGVPAKPKAGR